MRGIAQVTLLTFTACGSEFEPPPAPKAPEITVGLASTRLGADCGAQREEAKASPEPTERIPCEQTAVHLSIRSATAASATTIKMKRVELLDRNGEVLEVLTSHSPSQWGTDRFVAWDEVTVPGQIMAVGYKLSSPNWAKIPNANKRSFKMRVTVMVGSSVQTLEATAELRIEDTSNVVT